MWREWIEMSLPAGKNTGKRCLPPCGGSGLKWHIHGLELPLDMSPSVWREWIEMRSGNISPDALCVSLRVEGVD